MGRHYVNAALHSLGRSPTYAAICLSGLAVAFAALLLIGAYVRTELTHDRWMPGYEDVYRLGKTLTFQGQRLAGNSSAEVEALWLKQDIPEVQSVARLWPQTRTLRSNKVELAATVVWADPQVFRVLPFPLVGGDRSAVLEEPDAIVVSRALAYRLLGSEQAVGKTIEVDGEPMRIAAVLDSLPGPSHLAIDALASGNSAHSPFAAQNPGHFGFGLVYTYLRTTPGALAAVHDALPALIDRHVSAADVRGIDAGTRLSSVYAYELQPLSGIHMMSQQDRLVPESTDLFEPAGDLQRVLALSAIALLILLVATANFVNIMSAKAAQRAVEIGMRKVTGASRFDLVRQFVGESTVLAAVGAVVGVTAGLLCLRGFGAYLDRDLEPVSLADPVLVIGAVPVMLLVGVLGGIYPGLLMSAFRPAQILKGEATLATRVGVLRHALVIFQFALLIVLVVAVAVIGQQVGFLLQNNFRVNTDQLLYIDAPCSDALKDRIAALPGILGVACSTKSLLGMEGSPVVPASLPDGTSFRFNVIGVGPGALELYGLKPLAGRFLSDRAAGPTSQEGNESAPPGVVINRAALRGMRFDSPEEAIGRSLPGSVGNPPQIIGVVDDFHLRSLRDPVGPMVFQPAREPALILVKLGGENIQQTLRGIEQVWKTSGHAGPLKSQFHDQFVRRQYEDIARMRQLFTAFSIVAALLAALGIYGLSALTLEQGVVGIGVRKAFGAGWTDILRLLLWRFTTPVLLASLLAWPISFWLMHRWLQGFAYHTGIEPWIFLAATACALMVALAAVISHVLQLARVRPVVALRHR